jgi:hypothetical protein
MYDMNTQETNKDMGQEKNVSLEKKAFRKKGGVYLLLAVICIAIYILMSTSTTPGTQGTNIMVGIFLAALVLFVGGLVYLVRGFVGRE